MVRTTVQDAKAVKDTITTLDLLHELILSAKKVGYTEQEIIEQLRFIWRRS
jgi:hypothetical protein